MKIWKTGDAVRITYRGRTVDGAIQLASPNGRSIMLSFEAVLGNYAGGMPAMRGENGGPFYCLVNNEEVTLA